MPAFAPVDRPLVLGAWVAVGDGDDDGDGDSDGDAVLDPDGEGEDVGEDEEVACLVGIGSPNFIAIVNFGRLPPSLQQSSEFPQHHSRLV
jgi:hypothetical protein